jgi:hypothetical protein
MTEPSTAVQDKLAQATSRRAAEQSSTMPAPPTPKQAKQATVLSSSSPNGSPAAGNGTAKYLLLDHFVGGSTGTFWTYDGTTWRAAGTNESDEQGMAQVAFAANRVDMWWDANDAVTVVRSWKFL